MGGDPAAEGRTLAEVVGDLPFLLKVLAIGSALSLQAHPSAEQAVAGFAREEEAGLPITGANIARAMQLSAPTVHEMIGRLERDGYITRGPDKALLFTDSGRDQAEAIRIMGAALAQNPLVVEYKKVERWAGTFPTTFMGGDAGASTLWSLPGQGPSQAGATTSATR